jgi:hypothetical protein
VLCSKIVICVQELVCVQGMVCVVLKDSGMCWEKG